MLYWVASLLVLLFFSIGIQAREFVSADGKKTLEGDFISLNKDAQTVQLRLETGKIIEAETAFFSEGDRNYFSTTAEKYGPYLSAPAHYRRRFIPGDRLSMWKNADLGRQSDAAVLEGLRWLKNKQAPDGSWKEGGHPVGNTALALLAYLGNGHSPLSFEFGDTIVKAMAFLIANGRENKGLMCHNLMDNSRVYEHAIATQALAEAYIICETIQIEFPWLKKIVQNAGDLIIDKQHRISGGWCYSFDQSGARGGDLSITVWDVQALIACRNTELDFDGLSASLEKAAAFVKGLAKNDGGFGYAGKRGARVFGYDSLTGAGVYSLNLFDLANEKEAMQGMSYIANKSKFKYDSEWCDLSALYFETLAVKSSDRGRLWAERRISHLIEQQRSDGSWPVPGNGNATNAIASLFLTNEIYRQCLCLFILESPYR